MSISEKIKQGKSSDSLKSCDKEGRILHPSFKTLNINITGRCNEQCVYCPYHQYGYHKKGKDIDESLFLGVTKEAYDLGVTDVGFYTTGEPFLNPKMYEYIAWCKKLGYSYIYLSTNGLLCTLDNFRKVVDAGLDSLKFSVSGGSRSTFYKHHGVDKFDQVKENIIQASQYRKQKNLGIKLYMFVIVTKFNVNEKELIFKTFSDYVDEIIFTDCINDRLVPMIGMDEYLIQTSDPRCSSINIPCAELFNKIVVDEDGWLCACCQSREFMKVADLKKVKLCEAINCDSLVDLRKRHLQRDVKGTVCENCSTGKFKRENLHAMNGNLEDICRSKTPIDIKDDIVKRFQLLDERDE